MPIKIDSVGSLCMMNTKTGKTFDFGEVKNVECDFGMSDKAEPIIHTTGEATLEINNCDINKEQLNKIWQSALDDGRAFEGYMDIPYLVQKRTHKKRRINKKWRKRYGMVMCTKRVYAKKIVHKPENWYGNGIQNFEIEFTDDSWKTLREISENRLMGNYLGGRNESNIFQKD